MAPSHRRSRKHVSKAQLKEPRHHGRWRAVQPSPLRRRHRPLHLRPANRTSAEVLKELDEASAQVDLRINRVKTEAMQNDQCAMGTITLDSDTILFADKYTNLGQIIAQNHKIDDKIRR